MKTIHTILAIILLTLAGQAMALTPIPMRGNQISKATELFCKSVETRNYEMMDTLLAQGADVNGVCYFGYNGGKGHVTPLLFAVAAQGEYGGDYTNVIDYLLDHGADVNARNGNGGTPLILAANIFGRNWEEADRIIPLFIAKGAKLASVDKAGHTAFEYLAGGSYSPANIELWKKNFYVLLGRGVDINNKDKNGVTPLIRSAGACGTTSVEMLLGAGANPSLKDNKGETAYDKAMESAALSRQPSCNNVVRVLSNPQDYMGHDTKEPAYSPGASRAPAPQATPLDALNLLGKILK